MEKRTRVLLADANEEFRILLRQLLEETDLSVQEICNAVGYNNTCYFYHLFKEAEGVSPADYRVNTGRSKE